MNEQMLNNELLNNKIVDSMQAMQRLNEFKRFVILLFDDNNSVYDQGERVNSFLGEEFKEDYQSVVLDIDGDDFELEMEKSIS